MLGKKLELFGLRKCSRHTRTVRASVCVYTVVYTCGHILCTVHSIRTHILHIRRYCVRVQTRYSYVCVVHIHTLV